MLAAPRECPQRSLGAQDLRGALGGDVDEAAARRSLRAQIATLERRRATRPSSHSVPPGGPRMLTLAELERARDEMVAADAAARAVRTAAEAERAGLRLLLEQVRADPRRHRFVRIPFAALGECGCGAYHVRPRLSLIGMLAGWWELTMSSGCP